MDKKIIIKNSDVSSTPEKIVIWMSAVPDEIYEKTNKFVRAQTNFGYYEIGYSKDLP